MIIQSNIFVIANPKQHFPIYYRVECEGSGEDGDDGGGSSVALLSLDTPLSLPTLLHRQALDDEYAVFFNPCSSAGPVVLNTTAQRVWEAFAQPVTLAELGISYESEVYPLIHRLVEVGLLQTADTPSTFRPRETFTTLSAWLHVTNHCNLACDYCYIAKSDEKMSLEVGLTAIETIFATAQRHQYQNIHLKFAGGEATLALPLVLQLYDYAVERSHKTGIPFEASLLTNGVALSEKAILALQQRAFRLMISLDGVEAVHDQTRKFANQRGSFRWVERTLERLAKHGVVPFINVTVTAHNVDHLPQTVGELLARQLPFNLNLYRDAACVASPEALRLEEQRLITGLTQAFATIEEHLPSFSLLNILLDHSDFSSPSQTSCSMGEAYLVIDHQGRIAKCQMELAHPVTNIYASDPLLAIRQDTEGIQNVPVEEKEGCRSCEWKYWCTGGCPVQTYRATGRYDVQSPYCNIYKALYPHLIRLEGLRIRRQSS